ncbi:MmgE/PrpD family protein [Verticiella sediminum]
MNAAMQSDMLERLVAITGSVRYENLSAACVHAAKRAILDSLGCAIAAIGCEPVRIAASAMPAGAPEATVIGESGKSSLERAVLLNGMLLRYLDLLDVYRAQDACHPSENVSLALAAVESCQGSGRGLIEAVVAGYEAQSRLARLFSLQHMGMHHVSAAGLVAPLVIARAWQLSPEVAAHAAALSGVRQFTLHALSKGNLSMAKAIGYAWSCKEALLAVRLAQGGYTGPVHLLNWLTHDGQAKGSLDCTALAGDDTALIEHVSFKQFPVQVDLQTPNEVAQRLHARLDHAEIELVEIAMPGRAVERTADPSKFQPGTRETADHSLPVSVAISLLDGRLTATQFEHGRWADPEVGALVARTRVVVDDEMAAAHPQGSPARVTVTTRDGRCFSEFEAVASGDRARPLDDTALERKFMLNVLPVLGEARAREIVEAVASLDKLERIDELTHLLAA